MIPLLRPRFLRIVTKKSVYLEALRRHYVEYVQGQSPEPRVREYFYYIDHQGMVLFILLVEEKQVELIVL